jgi:hypothetical protein
VRLKIRPPLRFRKQLSRVQEPQMVRATSRQLYILHGGTFCALNPSFLHTLCRIQHISEQRTNDFQDHRCAFPYFRRCLTHTGSCTLAIVTVQETYLGLIRGGRSLRCSFSRRQFELVCSKTAKNTILSVQT